MKGVKQGVVTYNEDLIDSSVHSPRYIFYTPARRRVIPNVPSYNTMMNDSYKRKMVDEVNNLIAYDSLAGSFRKMGRTLVSLFMRCMGMVNMSMQ